MRFRQLELVRYGGFADRPIDLGDGQIDLHIVVGHNEAGKSTLLEAIGDVLFGFHKRSPQNWRYDYKELRLRATVEKDGEILDFIRRKGDVNTLLGPDGGPLADDILAPFLSGVDRKAFERMYGLDHAKLREGGQAILNGRDDAAQLVLAAGTGLGTISSALAKLDAEAGALFKSGAQLPVINKLFKDRIEALADVRSATLSENAWTAIQKSRADAGENRSALQGESHDLALRAAALERIGRVRGPLARLAQAEAALAELGDVRLMPEDAQERLAAARSERATAIELAAEQGLVASRAEDIIRSTALVPGLIEERDRIETLEERRPVIEKAKADLGRREAELDRSDVRLDSARREIGLAPNAPLPSAGWRRRARQHLEAARDLEGDEARLTTATHQAGLSREQLEADRIATGTAPEIDALRTAADDVPADHQDRLTESRDNQQRALRRLHAALEALAPWRGSAGDLAKLSIPVAADVDREAERQRDLRTLKATAETEAGSFGKAVIDAASRIALLAEGRILPTPEAVSAARNQRNEHLGEVRQRLARLRAADDNEAGDRLFTAIANADTLVDSRDAEAERLASYARAIIDLDQARSHEKLATERAATATAALTQATAEWSDRLSALGFTSPIPPEGLSLWRTERDRALTASDEADDANTLLDRLEAIAVHRKMVLTAVLTAAGIQPAAEELLQTLRSMALTQIAQAEARARMLDGIEQRDAALRIQESDIDTQRAALAARAASLKATCFGLAEELGLAEDASSAMISDALEAGESVATEASAREGLVRQIAALRQDQLAFDADVHSLSSDLDRKRLTTSTEDVRALSLALRAAVTDASKILTARGEIEHARVGLQESERRKLAAEAVLSDLMALAGKKDETGIIAAIAESETARRFSDERRITLGDLVAIGDGFTREQLADQVGSVSPDEASAELAAIATRRHELEADREDIGRRLAEADAGALKAATETGAADAQQRVSETNAAISDAAERHVEVATAAAVLRWMIGRHRAASQGPLITRAAKLFRGVTRGAFETLTLEYGEDDQPRIVAVRPGGAAVGPEGMSEGTRDQLYLSLRLGAIAGRADALPLICDDLLITADDLRAAAMLQVLQTASADTQVILFTHHDHIVDVARSTLGEDAFQLHNLNGTQRITLPA